MYSHVLENRLLHKGETYAGHPRLLMGWEYECGTVPVLACVDGCCTPRERNFCDWVYNSGEQYVIDIDGGGGSGRSGSSGAEYFEVEAPPVGEVDLNERLDCFGNIPNSGAQYSVQLHVDLANPNNEYQEVKGMNDAGHVFLTLTKSNGGQSHTLSFGFYPESAVKSFSHTWVDSKMVDDSQIGGRESNIHIGMSGLTQVQFDTLMNQAKTLVAGNYHISQYNCANYALDVFNSIRPISSQIRVLDSYWYGKNIGTSPAGVYRRLDHMYKNGDSTIKKETKQPNSSPDC